jgi:signal transduction histidine kinase/CheY-like chemotaxis protein
MTKPHNSIRVQLIVVTVVALLALAALLEVINFSRQQVVLIDTERRVGLTLIRSVNNTINSVRSFINTLGDIAELDTRLAELVGLNANIDFIAVTDVDGTIIFHSQDNLEGEIVSELANLPPDATVQKTIPGFDAVFLTSLTFDSSDLTEPAAFQIIIASAADPIQSQLAEAALSSLLVTALVVLVAAVLMIVLLQAYFVRPVEELSKASRAIEAGNLSMRVNVKQNNEFGQLAAGFNSMTQQLAQLINTLEDRVQRRTRELEIARDQAEQASRAKSDFLSNMSHELRTPLNMIIGYTSSMLTMPQMYNNVSLPPIYREDIELIGDSGKHLLTLINDILDLSKIEAGKLELAPSAVDLKATFDSVVAVSLGLIGEKPLQLRQKYPAELPKVWGDNVRIRQILLNLLSNAIKYTETGSVTLFAEVHGASVAISVIDTGPGIHETNLKSIFDRFQQIKNQADVQGTGLGLDISQRLAQLHGAEITIESAVGRGSTFAFSLPIATPEQLSQPVQTQPAPINAEHFRAINTAKKTAVVFAVDIGLRQQLRQLLERLDVVVLEATDGQNAADLAGGLLPDVLLLDAEVDVREQQLLFDQLSTDSETRLVPIISVQEPGAPPLDRAKAVIYKPLEPEQLKQALQSISSIAQI